MGAAANPVISAGCMLRGGRPVSADVTSERHPPGICQIGPANLRVSQSLQRAAYP